MNYPKDIKAFYMRMNDDGKTVAAMDVLAPGIGEIIGGSQREERLDVLDRRLAEMQPRSARPTGGTATCGRYGTVPHAGFGLGFERTIMYATGMANIRDVIPFPAHARPRRVLGACPSNGMGRAHGACEVRSEARGGGDAGHRRRRATTSSPATPMRPPGSGGVPDCGVAAPGQGPALPASRRLASAGTALTRPMP